MTSYAYVHNFEPNMKICGGLIATDADLASFLAGDIDELEYGKKRDPEGLLLPSLDKPFPEDGDEGYKKITNVPKNYLDTEEGAIAMCRQWYDKWAYGEAYCCQMMRVKTMVKDAVAGEDTEYKYSMDISGPYSSTKAAKQEIVKGNMADGTGMEIEFHALVMKNARATLASVLALAAVTAAYVN
jgi:hypothetical protein